MAGDIVCRDGEYYAVYYFTASDCEAVASSISSNDRWADDLLADAEKIRDLEKDAARDP